jgi:EmrB/QacA subfamily drug resistance transporter
VTGWPVAGPTESPAPDPGARGGRHAGESQPPLGGNWILVPVTLTAFVVGLDNTVVNVAAPTIRHSLNLSHTMLEWVAAGYILAFASLLLLGGRLTDIYGRHRIFLCALAGFGLTSALAAFAPNGTALVAARVVQGIAAAMVLPSTLAILSADLDDDARHLGVGLWTGGLASSLALGPVIGGVVTQHLGWRAVFWVNVPIVIVTLLLGVLTMTGRPERRTGVGERPGLDLPGAIASVVCLSAVSFVLVDGHDEGYGSPLILGLIAVFVLSGIAFVVVERAASAPLADVSLFRSRVFVGGTVAQMMWGLGVNGVFFFTSLYLQNVLGYSPTQSGLTFVPLAICLMVTVPLVPATVRALGDRVTVLIGMLGVAGGLVQVSFCGTHATYPQLLPGLILTGVGSAFTTPLTSSVLAVVPGGKEGIASALVSAAREVSGVLGIAVTGAIVAARGGDAAHIVGDGIEPFVRGYASGIRVGAALVAFGGIVGFLTMPGCSCPAS